MPNEKDSRRKPAVTPKPPADALAVLAEMEREIVAARTAIARAYELAAQARHLAGRGN